MLILLIALFQFAELASNASSDAAPPCTRERIIWQDGLKIGIGDFVGPLGNPRHSAEANTGIATSSRAGGNPATFIVEAETFFDPCKSWFRPDEPDAQNTLEHERIHFDISEVYARKLMARYATEIKNYAQFARTHDRLYNEVWRESRRTQDQYDTEVYADRERQTYWADWVADQLEATTPWAKKRLELPMR